MVTPPSRPKSPDRHSKPAPALAYDWGLELWKNNPQLFLISEHLQGALPTGASPPACGQLRWFLPENAHVGLYDEFGTKRCPGAITKGRWEPSKSEPVGPEAMKLIYSNSGSIDCRHLRPAILLGKPHRQGSHAQRSAGTLLDFGRAIMVPGYGTGRPGLHGQLHLHSLRWNKSGSFQFWMAWGIDIGSGSELLPIYDCLERCDATQSRELSIDENTHDAAHRLLAEVLGLRRPLRRWGPPGTWEKRPRRGEVVTIRFRPDGLEVPCVVISSDQFNDQGLDVVTVLQCVGYVPKADEQSPIVIPLGTDGACRGVRGRWSIDPTLVRGISLASTRLTCLPDRVFMTKEDPGRFDRLERRLRFFYA
ncbi:MAG: hypothetical protein JWM10_4164 [Myxococcaceae bacterium]|nr:hypothetical protein [Myxococcaceae bacterium]